MLSAHDLGLTYQDGESSTGLFAHLNLTFGEAGLTLLVGRSGSGKSSLLYLLAGLRRPTQGSVSFEGSPYSSLKPRALERLRRQAFGFVFQQHFLIPYMNVLENVLVGAPTAERTYLDRAKGLLAQFGLEAQLHRLPAQLSGGQRQRVAIARALIHEPKVLFADEPTASLDRERADQVVALLREVATHRLVLLVTHDLSLVRPTDRLLRVADGHVIDVTTAPTS